jgi:hypothetical protein
VYIVLLVEIEWEKPYPAHCSLLSLCSSKEPKGNPSLPNLKSKPFPAKKLQKSKNQTQPIDEMRGPSLSFTKTHFS